MLWSSLPSWSDCSPAPWVPRRGSARDCHGRGCVRGCPRHGCDRGRPHPRGCAHARRAEYQSIKRKLQSSNTELNSKQSTN